MGMGNFGMTGGLGMLIFWGIVIVVVVWIVRTLFGPADKRSSEEEPGALEILEKRYARGEIDRDEFELKRRDLDP